MLGIFLDSETNGLNPVIHHPVELAFKIIDLYSGKELNSYESIIQLSYDEWKKSDLNSLKINGFNWDIIKNGKDLKNIKNDIIDLFKSYGIEREKAVFICQNPSFDRAFFSQIIDSDTQEILKWPYHWLDLASMYWALTLSEAKKNLGPLPWETGFTKDLIASSVHLPQEQLPHKAMNGVKHLLLCYKKIVGFPYLEK